VDDPSFDFRFPKPDQKPERRNRGEATNVGAGENNEKRRGFFLYRELKREYVPSVPGSYPAPINTRLRVGPIKILLRRPTMAALPNLSFRV
jgi:hypothetical protein